MNFELLKEKHSFEISFSTEGTEIITTENINLLSLLSDLKKLPEFEFDFLVSICANDLIDENKFELYYTLYSLSTNKTIIIKTNCSRETAKLPSIQSLYKSAHFEEREIFDLFGIKFDGKSISRRLLLPNDWIGHPLRKDYTLQDERLDWNKR